jgi:hypothetical protein
MDNDYELRYLPLFYEDMFEKGFDYDLRAR